jgi:GntR family transcriptional regulator
MPSSPLDELVIDRNSPVPYYHQLKEILRAEIEHRHVGDQLPHDHELCARFEVSRTVVRQAMTDLQNEGLLERHKGRGTFVTPHRTSQSLVQVLTGLYDDVATLGLTLHSDVRALKVEAADAETARLLELSPGSAVVVLDRLRSVDGEPWVSTVSRLPAHLVPDLVDQDLREQSLYALLERRYGIVLARSHRTVEAHAADARLAADLQIPRHAPVLRLTSVAYTADGVPVETFVAYHRGDRSRFEVDVRRAADGAPQQPLVRRT